MELDNRDKQILQVLRESGRVSNVKIASDTKIPVTTVRKKIKQLEKQGTILQYTTRMDFDHLGFGSVAYILVTLDSRELKKLGETHESIAEKISTQFPYTTHVSAVSGRIDIILRLRAANNKELNKKVNVVRNIDGVLRTETLMALHDVKKKTIHSNISPKSWKKQEVKRS